jgi:hypothetical protein
LLSPTAHERQYAEFDIDLDAWATPKPFGISGCFRLRNESEFMVQAVESFLPWLDEAVLVVQPSDDDTVGLAEELALKHDKVRVEHYPFVPYQIGTQEHYQEPPNSVHHLVHMSNWALSRCKYSWIAKVEGDVIALSTFAGTVAQVRQNPDASRYYGLVILNLAGDGTKFSATNPRNHGWDEAVFNNHPRWHFVRHDKWESVQHWERSGENECMGWSLYHMKRCKAGYRDGWNDEVYLEMTPENLAGALQNYNRRHQYPGNDDPLGESALFEELPNEIAA